MHIIEFQKRLAKAFTNRPKALQSVLWPLFLVLFSKERSLRFGKSLTLADSFVAQLCNWFEW